MVIPDPYLPDIMEGVVARVNAAFSTRPTDPFNVLFEKGIYGQVSRSVYKRGWTNEVIVWLIMPFIERRGKDYSMWGDVTSNLIICLPTDGNFSQQERDDLSFTPRLKPVYEVLMQEIQRERWFSFAGPNKIDHMRVIRPYWGGSDVNGTNTENLFKKQVDAIGVNNLVTRVKLSQNNCNPSSYPLNKNTNYPAPPSILYFQDDLELIVGGGRSTDPLIGADSVIIPDLKGKMYTVYQRAFGQLRQERSIEVQDDATNGGFALLQGYKFSKDDTYIVKFRPTVVSDVAGLTGTLSKSVNSVFIGTNS
jgi:hypothetical protein